MSVVQTRVTNTCRFDKRQECAEILEKNTTLESLHDDPCNETNDLSRYRGKFASLRHSEQTCRAVDNVRKKRKCFSGSDQRRRGVLDCSVTSYSTLHRFSALAQESSFMLDRITRRLGPESEHRKQLESSGCTLSKSPGENAGGIGTILEGSQARSSLLFGIHDVCQKGETKKRSASHTTTDANYMEKRITPEPVHPTTSQNTVWRVSDNTHFADRNKPRAQLARHVRWWAWLRADNKGFFFNQ